MAALWNPESRFQFMLDVEVAVAKAQAEMGLIPPSAAKAIGERARFDVHEIDEIEKTTRHDVIAFVSSVAKSVGEEGRYVHYGLTSSDVLDTALSLQIQRAGSVLLKSLASWELALVKLVEKHAATLCAGRTHGMHAEPTSFGYKMAGHLTEVRRCMARLARALEQLKVGKISGAVGTFSALPQELEAKVCATLGLRPELVSTQVLPRDRHAELFFAFALIGTALERLSIELRHLQRTEVAEVREGFQKGQKGSSAMPHKRNPIGPENLTGAARMLRSYLVGALDNVALWHERDISHSSVERVFLGDAFILADYAADRMAKILVDLEVLEEQMSKNMQLSQGQLMSSHLLLVLVKKGLSREEAYSMVQKLSHDLQVGENLKDKAKKSSEVQKWLSEAEVEGVFAGQGLKDHLRRLSARGLQSPTGGWL